MSEESCCCYNTYISLGNRCGWHERHLSRLESLTYLSLSLLDLLAMVRSRLPSPFRFLQLSGLRVVTRRLRLVPRLLSPVSPCLTVDMCPEVLRKVPLESPGAEGVEDVALVAVDLSVEPFVAFLAAELVALVELFPPFPLVFVPLLVNGLPLPPTVLATLRQLRMLLGRRCIPLLTSVNRRLAMCLSRHWLREMMTRAFG